MNDFFYFIFYIIFSIFLIYGIHEFWLFLVDTYSTKKTKDLVNIQTNKYVQIIFNYSCYRFYISHSFIIGIIL